jgi:hypothetical protein
MGHYEYAKQVGAWGGERYLQAIEDYHASYASIHADPRTFLSENAELIRRMNTRLGYRLNLVEATWPPAVKRVEGFAVCATWQNAGVAPCLPGGNPIWTLCNERGETCAVLVDRDLDVRSLGPGSSGHDASMRSEGRFALPALLSPGTYSLYVSVGDAAGTSVIALPLDHGDGRLRYRIGDVRID